MKKKYLRFEHNLLTMLNNYSTNRIIFILLGFILSISIVFLFIPGIPQAHDLTFHLSRISSIAESFSIGEMPRVYPGYVYGYGYANGLFYGDILLYIPAFFVMLGMDVIIAYKLFLILLTLATMSSVYFCTMKLTSSRYASLIATTICTLSTYRAIDIFVRGALAEVCAFIFIPLIIIGIYYVLYDNPQRWYWLSIGFAGCFLTHNISFALMVGFTFLFVCFSIRKLTKEKNRLGYLILATLVTIGIVGYFLFPMIEQMISDQFILTTETITTDISASTRSFIEVFLGLPYRKYDGIAGIGCIFLFVVLLRLNPKLGKFNLNYLMDQMYLFSVLSILAVTTLFPWSLILKVFPPLAMIQFSWRLFLMITIFLSLLGGYYITKIFVSNKQKLRVYGVVLLLLIVPFAINVGQQYASYFYHVNITGLMDPVNISNYSIGLGEYLPSDVDLDFIADRQEVITSNNEFVQVAFEREGIKLEVTYQDAGSKTYLDLPLIYYKGYQVDDDALSIVKSSDGLVRVLLNGKVEGNFIVSYEGTSLAHITRYISLITVGGLIIYMYMSTRTCKRKVN